MVEAFSTGEVGRRGGGCLPPHMPTRVGLLCKASVVSGSFIGGQWK